MPGIGYTLAFRRVKVRPELPGNFSLRENLPGSSGLSPLTRLGEGVGCG